MNSLENSILQLKNYKLLLPQEAGNLTPSAIDNFIDKLEKEKQNIENYNNFQINSIELKILLFLITINSIIIMLPIFIDLTFADQK